MPIVHCTCGEELRGAEARINGICNSCYKILLERRREEEGRAVTVKQYRVVLVPSSEDENAYVDVDDINRAIEIGEQRDKQGLYSSLTIHEFSTEKERAAFIEGYEEGVGYLGSGVRYTDEIEKEIKCKRSVAKKS